MKSVTGSQGPHWAMLCSMYVTETSQTVVLLWMLFIFLGELLRSARILFPPAFASCILTPSTLVYLYMGHAGLVRR